MDSLKKTEFGKTKELIKKKKASFVNLKSCLGNWGLGYSSAKVLCG